MKHDWLGKTDLKAASRAALEKALKAGPWKEAEVDYGAFGKVKSEKGRGTFQMTVELTKDGPRAATLSPPGQNEDPASAHAGDQVKNFKEWTYPPFPFKRGDMK
jgi:hypothetical protein